MPLLVVLGRSLGGGNGEQRCTIEVTSKVAQRYVAPEQENQANNQLTTLMTTGPQFVKRVQEEPDGDKASRPLMEP